MYMVLVALGGLLSVGGAALIAFGLPNSGGDINTSIITGTTALVGGLILLALCEAIRHLRRIGESMMARPVGRAPRDLFEPAAEPAVVAMPQTQAAAAPRVPFPPKVEPRKRAPMSVEPRLDMAPSIDAGADNFERQMPAFGRSMPEPRVIPEREDTPLSPAEPRLSATREEKDDLSEGLLATAFSRLDVSGRPAPPMAEPPPKKETFDTAWPPLQRKAVAEEPKPHLEVRQDVPVAEPPMDDEPAESETPYAVSILKSGVVDGMAYTLYSDGSIEAEMPQGTMRFASINELRAYLEKSSA